MLENFFFVNFGLEALLLSNLFTIVLITFINKQHSSLIRIISLVFSGWIFLQSLCLYLNFASIDSNFQYAFSVTLPVFVNIYFSFGLDNISILFVLLTTFLIFLSIFFILNDEKYFKDFVLLLLWIQLFLIIVFSATSLILFYIFFEAIIIPMYLLIGLGGSRERKIRAVYLFFFYTLCGSILFLLSILYIYSVTGSFDFEYLSYYVQILFSENEQAVLFICFFIAFASKIPMFPFHIWLPEAHVEAPTIGSVLLAGILLKLGVYGMLRCMPWFIVAYQFHYPIIFTLSILGIISASMSAICQTDMKRIIAYSSVAHMNLVALGVFSSNYFSYEGALLQSVSHGFVSGGLFFLIGILYDRYHSRFIQYYGGLVHVMPLFAVVFLIFNFANIAIPGTSNFVGEFLLLLGIYKSNFIASIVSALGVILCGAYSLWLYNRIIFSNLKSDATLSFRDLTLKESLVMLPLTILIFVVGVYPHSFLNIFVL